jgi:glycerophosphoryl diester phosphodiesterase
VKRKPLLLGHRGCRSAGITENSLDAFAHAMSQGCEGFEFDVRQARDGRNVIWHDPTCCGKEVASTDTAELLGPDSRHLAVLEDVLTKFGNSAYLDIELKVSGREESIVAALRANPPQRGFILSSFFPEILLRLHSLDDKLPLGFICDRRSALEVWRDLPVQVVLPRYNLLQPQIIEEVHQSGRQIMTWTVNTKEQLLSASKWGIDGLISDDPELLYQTFHSD